MAEKSHYHSQPWTIIFLKTRLSSGGAEWNFVRVDGFGCFLTGVIKGQGGGVFHKNEKELIFSFIIRRFHRSELPEIY